MLVWTSASIILCARWGRYDVVTYIATNFLQIFLCSSFSSISPRAIELEEVTFKEVMFRGELKRKKSHLYVPMA